MHKRRFGHPLHPDLTPDVLTGVLSLGPNRSGKENEFDSAHFVFTIIQFTAHAILMLNTHALAYTTKGVHAQLHINRRPVVMDM